MYTKNSWVFQGTINHMQGFRTSKIFYLLLYLKDHIIYVSDESLNVHGMVAEVSAAVFLNIYIL